MSRELEHSVITNAIAHCIETWGEKKPKKQIGVSNDKLEMYKAAATRVQDHLDAYTDGADIE